MTGGMIQLVAYGPEDMFITRDPQITFFKTVYRRHTNFSVEQMIQKFPSQQVNFGNKITTVILKNSDLMGKIYLVVTLPEIKKISDPLTKFAWVRRVGFSMIKTVEIYIGGKLIDRHYGEWLSLWADMCGMYSTDKMHGINKMIGDVPELTEFSNSKKQYTMYIPLSFWFCRSDSLALPLVALQYCDVTMSVEFYDANMCYMLAPTNYIVCNNDLVNLIPYEYIEQTVGNNLIAGIFINYDIITKRLYYYQITSNTFYYSSNYPIVGKTSNFSVYPTTNATSRVYSNANIRNLNIVDCHLLVDYIFVDIDERQRFLQNKHDYLIEQLYYTNPATIKGVNASINLSIDQPCKLIVWLVQMQYIENSLDYYNYTDNYARVMGSNSTKNEPIGNNIILQETILLNGYERISLRAYDYFSYIQQYQCTDFMTQQGVQMYSFALKPTEIQPSGTCNMGQINNIQVQMQLSNVINVNNPATFRCYSLCYNMFRCHNGIGGLVFVK